MELIEPTISFLMGFPLYHYIRKRGFYILEKSIFPKFRSILV